MLGIGRFSGRAAAAGVVSVAIIFRGAPTAGRILAKSPPGRLSSDSLPRETSLGSIKSGFFAEMALQTKEPLNQR